MADDYIVNRTELIADLEKELNSINTDDRLYWYDRLEEIGKQSQTMEMVFEAVKQFDTVNPHYLILKVVAKKHLTREICELAVCKNGLNLAYVPEDFQDEDMSFMAVRNDGDVLRSVRESVLCGEKGYEICCVAVNNSVTGSAIAYVPKQLMRADQGRHLCEIAVRANGYAIEWMPKKFIRKELVEYSARGWTP